MDKTINKNGIWDACSTVDIIDCYRLPQTATDWLTAQKRTGLGWDWMDLWTHLCYEWAPLCGANKSKMLTKILKWFYSKSYICDKLAFLWINEKQNAPQKTVFVFFPSQNNCLLLILDGQALGKTFKKRAWVPFSIIHIQRSDKMLQSTNNISIE